MLSTHCFAHLVVLSFEICFWLEIITNKTTESNWRLSCKRGVCSILGRFLFFAGSSWFLADWLVLAWGASLRGCFCWFALRFREVAYARSSVFQGYLLDVFCRVKNKRNLCFAKRWSHRSMVFAASFIIHIITQFSYCCFVSTSK